jgi:hypothetical protein
VAIVGVTIAVVIRSQLSDEKELSDGTALSEYTKFGSVYDAENSMESTALYENSPEFESGTNGWGAPTDGNYISSGVEMASEGLSPSFMGYYENNSDENAASPFPFATSNWDDQSTTYTDNEYSGSQDESRMDTSSPYEDNWTNLSQQDDRSNINDYDAKNTYFDESTSPFENFNPEINNDQEDVPARPIESDNTQKSNFSPFGTPPKKKDRGDDGFKTAILSFWCTI